MTGPSPFTVLEDAFRLLGAQPCPLAMDGRQLGHGLPCRQIPIVELRSILTAPTASSDLQHHLIGAVLCRMHQHPATWVVVLGGLLLPGLRCVADQMTALDQRPASEVETELLWRLLTATRRSSRHAHRFAVSLLQLAPASCPGNATSPTPSTPIDHPG